MDPTDLHYASRHTRIHTELIYKRWGECIDAQVNQRAIVYVGYNARRASLYIIQIF